MLEKETRMRETMKMMGLNQWVLWTTWYLKQFIFFFFPVVAITLLLKVEKRRGKGRETSERSRTILSKC